MRSSTRDFAKGKNLPPAKIAKLRAGQRVNHFPGSSLIGRKDRLAEGFNRKRREFGADTFDFHPRTFQLPDDAKLVESAVRNKKLCPLFIHKPAASSCGKGISLISTRRGINRVCKDKKKSILQSYVKNPYLINGFKFDLRLYVIVTSYDPLVVHLSEDGLVRLTTRKYTAARSKLHQRNIHLTNYSVQKKAKGYVKASGDGEAGSASKWNVKDLWGFLSERHGPEAVDTLKEQIKEVVIKTLLIPEVDICGRSHAHGVRWDSCFELFGFDILLDKKLKPWLLEVNCLPSISSSSPLDRYIKCRLCCDTFHLLGLKPIDFRAQAKKKATTSVSANPVSPRIRRRHIFELMKTDLQKDNLHEDDIALLRELYEQLVRRTATMLGLGTGSLVFANGLLTIINVVSAIVHPRRAILGLYFMGFGLLSVFAELEWKSFTEKSFPFLHHHFGRGMWYIFIGLLAMEDSSWTYMVVSCTMLATGASNIAIALNIPPEKKEAETKDAVELSGYDMSVLSEMQHSQIGNYQTKSESDIEILEQLDTSPATEIQNVAVCVENEMDSPFVGYENNQSEIQILSGIDSPIHPSDFEAVIGPAYDEI